jgi:SAM-dependent methyltransferase
LLHLDSQERGLHSRSAAGLRSPPGRANERRTIEEHPYFEGLRSQAQSRSLRARLHGKTELRVAVEIARSLTNFGSGRSRLLEINAEAGLQTVVFRDQLRRPEVPVIYDGNDVRHPQVATETDFRQVDLETERFPAGSGSFDVVVWNRELVTLKNAVAALSEVARVLEPGGLLVLTVPNLAALHNRLLLAAGFQPTTLHIDGGDHVRGFAVRSMTTFLRTRAHFRVLEVRAIGLHPFASARLPRALRNLGHTIIWVLEKQNGRAPPTRAFTLSSSTGRQRGV